MLYSSNSDLNYFWGLMVVSQVFALTCVVTAGKSLASESTQAISKDMRVFKFDFPNLASDCYSN